MAFKITTPKIKYLGINLTKKAKKTYMLRTVKH